MKDLQWHEPAAYRRAIYYENERHDPWASAKFAGVAFLVMLGLRLLARSGPDTHPPGWPATIGVAAAVAVFLAYGLPAIMSLVPGSIVIVSDKGINNNVLAGRAWSIRFWPWDQISSCALHADDAGGRQYAVMSVYDNAGATLVTVALAASPSPSEIAQLFAVYGKELRTLPSSHLPTR